MFEHIRKILQEGEGINTEFKTSKTELNKNTFESICAFLNRKGGNLLFGVKDDGTIEGIEEAKIQSIVDRLVSLMNNLQKLSPTIYLVPEIISIDGKKIIYLQIPESSQVHSTSGKIFDRNSDGDFNISGNHRLVEELYMRKSNSFSETNIFRFLALSDLSSELISRVRKLAIIQKPGHPWESMNDEELLRSAKLYRKDFKTGEEGYTLAAVLLFGIKHDGQNQITSRRNEAANPIPYKYKQRKIKATPALSVFQKAV
jgi:ATP-dependent DNA helicase RecG